MLTNPLAQFAGVASLLVIFLIVSSVGSMITYLIIVVANRADPDPTGKRPITVYLVGAAFLFLWAAYIGSVVIISSLIGLIGTNYGPSPGDAAARGVTVGLLIALVAGLLHVMHFRKALELADGESDPSSPTKRVVRSYVAVVSFISMLVLVVVSITMLWTLFGIIAPGVYHAPKRLDSFKNLLDQAYILFLSWFVFWGHQKIAPSSLRLFGGSKPAATVDTVTVSE